MREAIPQVLPLHTIVRCAWLKSAAPHAPEGKPPPSDFGPVGPLPVGAGSVADTFGNLFSSTLLPAGGVRLRYRAVPASGVNISVDYAWGKSGSGGLYVYIGDAF